MTESYIKKLGPHSRLHLDNCWTEATLASVEEKCWRVVIKPQRNLNGTYLSRQEDGVYCQFQKFNGRSLWAVWGTSDRQVVKNHLAILPLMLRDLSDASRGILQSSAHLLHWKSAASQAIDFLETNETLFSDSHTISAITNSLTEVLMQDLEFETLVHGDFHPGNVLSNGLPSPYRHGVSDLENLTVGTVFVDVIYCAVWAQFVTDSKSYWNLIRYLEQLHSRSLSALDLGLASTLLINQASQNHARIQKRILNGLSWFVNQSM